jgi:hypothetical protein
MAEITIDFPMNESAAVKVGDKVTLNFTEDCRPCWTPEDEGLFDHPLPQHDHHKGYQWTATAIKSGTIASSSVPCGEECEKKHHLGSTGRSIIVGD